MKIKKFIKLLTLIYYKRLKLKYIIVNKIQLISLFLSAIAMFLSPEYLQAVILYVADVVMHSLSKASFADQLKKSFGAKCLPKGKLDASSFKKAKSFARDIRFFALREVPMMTMLSQSLVYEGPRG